MSGPQGRRQPSELRSGSRRAAGLGGGEAPLQYVRLEAAFAQDVCGGGAAAARVAAHHVLSVLIQGVELEADEIQRNINRAVDTEVLEFAGQPYVQPLTSGGDDFLGVIIINPLQQRFVEQGLEVGL